MKRVTLVQCVCVGLAMALAGCGSSVRLDKPPVEDRSTSSAAATAAGANAGAAANANGVGSGNAVSSGSVASVSLPGAVGAGGKGASAQDAAAAAAQGKVVYFDYDSYAILPAYQPVIEANARSLLANPARKVTLEGHTDDRGGREYNLALGQKRADAVRRALALLGVRDSQMEAVSFGKEKPAVPGTSDEAMQKNRRVEISTQ